LSVDVPAGTWRVTGHDHAVEVLARSIESPAHSYLIAGPDHVGKRTLATEFAKALNCEAATPLQRPCQHCLTCRLIEVDGHPDVSRIDPPEDKDRILIEQVRVLRESISLLPSQAAWRVVIIQADLTEGASDALLKTLEEPSTQVVLLVTARDVEAVSETIASRCRTILLGLVDTEAIVADLEQSGVAPAAARDLANLSYGAIGWAKAAAVDPDLATRRAELRASLAAWSSRSLIDRLSAAEMLATASSRSDTKREVILEELEILLTWWRDVLLAVCGQPGLILNRGSRPEIEDFAANVTISHAQNVLRSIALASERIDQNVDPRLTLESLAMALGAGTTNDTVYSMRGV
jgi:DNA polymerase III subunit delta'